jgi:hypothetical protein
MKRQVYSLLLLLGLLVPSISLVNAPPVSAVDVLGGFCASSAAKNTDACKEKAGAAKGNPVVHAISIAISILAFIIGIASVIVVIISGFRIVTSQGDPQSVAKARTAIIYALVGLVVALLAGAIVSLVLSNL